MRYNPNLNNKEKIQKQNKIIEINGEYIDDKGNLFYGQAIIKNNILYDINSGKRLYKTPQNKKILNYIKNKGIFIYEKTFTPQQYYPPKENKKITRYFAIKKNSNNIFEINYNEYKKISQNSVMTRLYDLYQIQWNFFDKQFNYEQIQKNNYPKILINHLLNNF